MQNLYQKIVNYWSCNNFVSVHVLRIIYWTRLRKINTNDTSLYYIKCTYKRFYNYYYQFYHFNWTGEFNVHRNRHRKHLRSIYRCIVKSLFHAYNQYYSTKQYDPDLRFTSKSPYILINMPFSQKIPWSCGTRWTSFRNS